MADQEQPDVTSLTVQLLSAYFTSNTVPSGELAALIETTRAALLGAKAPDTPAAPEFIPAVSVRQSRASRDHLISMIDGKPYKTLRRHLSSHGLTSAEYRARYHLPDDYPMVAPNYSQYRRDIASRLGLGRKRATVVEVATPHEPVVTPAAPAPKPARKTKAAKPAASAEAPAQAPAAALESPVPSKAKSARKPAIKATPKSAAKPEVESSGLVAKPRKAKVKLAAPVAVETQTAEVAAPKPKTAVKRTTRKKTEPATE